MKPLRFTADDAQRAFETWGANCGPGAIAAVMGLTLDELRPQLGDFEAKRYTNPTLMIETLSRLGAAFQVTKGKPALAMWPDHGLARIQWEGPWTQPNVPPAAAYRHTHWVGVEWSEARRTAAIFDINLIGQGGWCALDDWSRILVPWLLKECEPNASGGWHITHAIEVTP